MLECLFGNYEPSMFLSLVHMIAVLRLVLHMGNNSCDRESF